MIQTTNSCSRTFPTLIRYLSRCQVSSAHCQSRWVSLAPLSMDMLSSSRRAALLRWNSAASQEQHSQRRLLQLYQKRRGEAQPLRLQITQAAGCPTRGTLPNTITSRRMTCRMQCLSRQYPSHRLLLFCLSHKQTLQHRLNSLLNSLLQILTVTQRSHHLCQRRKTNTVRKFLCWGFTFLPFPLLAAVKLLLTTKWWWPQGNALAYMRLSVKISQCQRLGREVSILWWAESDSWSQEWSRPKGADITQHIHCCGETILRLCLPEHKSLRHSALQIFLVYPSFLHPFLPPTSILWMCSYCRKELGTLQELRERAAFLSKTELARAVIWQQEHSHPHSCARQRY